MKNMENNTTKKIKTQGKIDHEPCTANELTGGLSIVMTATPSAPTSMVTLGAMATKQNKAKQSKAEQNLNKLAPLNDECGSIETTWGGTKSIDSFK